MKTKILQAKERKYPQLWQAYQWWDECVELRKKHLLRIGAIERGASSMDVDFEHEMLETMPWGQQITITKTKNVSMVMDLDMLIDSVTKVMINMGSLVPIWDWLTSIRGFAAGSLAAQIIAHIDDISKFSNVSKLWRFSGYGMYDYWYDGDKCMGPKDGWKSHVLEDKKTTELYFIVNEPKDGWELRHQIDRKCEGWVAPYNTRLKSTLYLATEQFIKQQTPIYRDIYDEEKERQAQLNPDMAKWIIDRRGRRKAIKIFLQHIYIKWREAEGLPVSEPYVQAIMGHSDIINPE
jgi:hypothetical protein